MQRILAVGIISMLIALVRCSGGNDDENLLIDEALLREWALTSIEAEDGSVQAPDTTYTVTFTRERGEAIDIDVIIEGPSLSVFDGCNFCGGVYQLTEDGLLGIFIDYCTVRACFPPPALGAFFVKALSEASSYEARGDGLRIVSTDGDNGERNILDFTAN